MRVTVDWFFISLLGVALIVPGRVARGQDVTEITPSLAAPAEKGAAAGSGEYDLLRCIQTALENNFDLLKNKERIRRQRGAVVEIRARSIPHAAINSDFRQIDKELLKTPTGFFFNPQSDWTVNLEVTQPIYTGGRNDALLKKQKHLEEAVLLELEVTLNRVLLEVRERYFAVLLARSEVGVQEQHLQLLEEELKSERGKFEAGRVSSFNVLRAEVALANGRTPLIRARNNLRLAIDEISRTLGLSSKKNESATPLKVVGELTYQPHPVELAQALQSAQENRPEFRRLNKLIDAQVQSLRSAKTGHQPQVSAFANYGAQQSSFSSSLTDEVHGWTVGLRGIWDLFDGLGTEGQVKQARSDFLLAVLELEQERLGVEVEVRRAHSSLVEATELVAASKKVVEQAMESLRLARARLDAGAATQLDVLDTQVALTRARTNEVQALYDHNVACARLNKAMGVSEKYTVTAD